MLRKKTRNRYAKFRCTSQLGIRMHSLNRGEMAVTVLTFTGNDNNNNRDIINRDGNGVGDDDRELLYNVSQSVKLYYIIYIYIYYFFSIFFTYYFLHFSVIHTSSQTCILLCRCAQARTQYTFHTI